MWPLRHMELVVLVAALHYSTRRTNVSTVRIATYFVLLITYFLT